MEEQLQIGLILMASAHGAPFLPKLTQIAKGNLAFSVGLMTLLIVATVIYMPIVLPLLLPGVTVDAGQIAGSLFFQMIVPLAIGLLVRARWEEAADEAKKPLAQISNVSLVLLLVLMLGLNIQNVIDLFGSGALLATLILTVVAVAAGYLLGGPGQDTRQRPRARHSPAEHGGRLPRGQRQLRRQTERPRLPGRRGVDRDGHQLPAGCRVRQAGERGWSGSDEWQRSRCRGRYLRWGREVVRTPWARPLRACTVDRAREATA